MRTCCRRAVTEVGFSGALGANSSNGSSPACCVSQRSVSARRLAGNALHGSDYRRSERGRVSGVFGQVRPVVAIRFQARTASRGMIAGPRQKSISSK